MGFGLRSQRRFYPHDLEAVETLSRLFSVALHIKGWGSARATYRTSWACSGRAGPSSARGDGGDAARTGSVPHAPGTWVGTNPVERLMGSWNSWVLDSAAQLRPRPPLAFDSEEKGAELRELHDIDRNLDRVAKACTERR
jgi:hypothetical protein